MKPDILLADVRCQFCKRKLGTLLCDFPVTTIINSLDFKPQKITCDKLICEDCATHIANEIDFCPNCMEKLRNMKPGNGDNDG